MLAKKMISMPECAACTKFGELMCERCGETYCSRECQLGDWREHRRICMPIPRLLPRAETYQHVYHVPVAPINRMLMGAPVNGNGFDSIDALGSVSDQSLQGETVQLTKERVAKLSGTFEKMQLEAKMTAPVPKEQSIEITNKPNNLTGIDEVLSTPPMTPEKKRNEAVQVENMKNKEVNNNNVASNMSNDFQATTVVEMKNNNITVTKVNRISDRASSVASAEKPASASVTPRQQSVVLTPPPKKTKNYKPWVQQIQAKIHVLLVHVEDHQTVYVIPSCEMKQWTTLIGRIEEYAESAELLRKPPQIGYIVLAKPKDSESYSRAWIKKMNSDKQVAKVEFLEYGFSDIVPYAEMKCLSEELVNVPRLVNKITLKGLPDEMKNAPEIVHFLTQVQERRTELVVQSLDLIEKAELTSHFSAILVDTEKFNTINDVVKKLMPAAEEEKIEVDIPQPSTPTQAQAQEQAQAKAVEDPKPGVEFKTISGKNLELFILDNSLMHIGYFSALEVKDSAVLGKNDAQVNENVHKFINEPPFYPRIAENCLALCGDDKRWYRAVCQDKEGDNYNLLYMDYGSVEMVPAERIREMRDEFFFPCVTSLCFIDGLDDQLTPNVVKHLKEKLQPYSSMKFDEVYVKGDDVYCVSSNIINDLKASGLIA